MIQLIRLLFAKLPKSSLCERTVPIIGRFLYFGTRKKTNETVWSIKKFWLHLFLQLAVTLRSIHK